MGATLDGRVPSPCDLSQPSTYNCLPSCRIPCRSERCLYQCHYDTLLEILNLAKTPAGGPSVPAFLQRVDTLGFYLEDDAVLRIDPLGQYQGKVTMADYIATFVHPTGLGGVFTVAGAGITAFANSGDVAAATFVLDFYATADPRRRISKVTGTMFNRFNSTTQKLRDADWAFLRFPQFQLELAADEPVPSRMSDATSASIVQGVCLVDQTVCRPLNVSGYDSPADCLSYMASIPRVDPYGGQGDNQFCRLVHLPYATVDPHHHCPHIGKSGGGACVNQNYSDYFKAFPEGTFMGKPSAGADSSGGKSKPKAVLIVKPRT